MPNPLPEWIQYTQALGTPTFTLVVAVTAAAIAYQQMTIARTKLKHDLYDRRFKLFDAVRKYMTIIIVNSGASSTETKEFLLASADSIFLFDNSIVNYVREIEQKSGIITVSNETLPHMLAGPARSDLEEKKRENLKWINEQSGVLADKFRPFLGLDQRRVH